MNFRYDSTRVWLTLLRRACVCVTLALALAMPTARQAAAAGGYCDGGQWGVSLVPTRVLLSGHVRGGGSVLVAVPVASGPRATLFVARSWDADGCAWEVDALPGGGMDLLLTAPGGAALYEWQIVEVDVPRVAGQAQTGVDLRELVIPVSVQFVLTRLFENQVIAWMLAVCLGGLFGYRTVVWLLDAAGAFAHARVERVASDECEDERCGEDVPEQYR